MQGFCSFLMLTTCTLCFQHDQELTRFMSIQAMVYPCSNASYFNFLVLVIKAPNRGPSERQGRSIAVFQPHQFFTISRQGRGVPSMNGWQRVLQHFMHGQCSLGTFDTPLHDVFVLSTRQGPCIDVVNSRPEILVGEVFMLSCSDPESQALSLIGNEASPAIEVLSCLDQQARLVTDHTLPSEDPGNAINRLQLDAC